MGHGDTSPPDGDPLPLAGVRSAPGKLTVALLRLSLPLPRLCFLPNENRTSGGRGAVVCDIICIELMSPLR